MTRISKWRSKQFKVLFGLSKPTHLHRICVQINAYCATCKLYSKKGSVSFKLTLDKNPGEQSKARNSTATDYIKVRVERSGEHDHMSKKVESSDEDDSTETDGEEASGGEEKAEEEKKEIKCPPSQRKNLFNENELVHKDMFVIPLLVNKNHLRIVLINNLTITLYYINPTGTTEKDVKNIFKMRQDYCKSQPIYSGKTWT